MSAARRIMFHSMADPEGCELPDVASARREAIRRIRTLLAHEARDCMVSDLTRTIRITDAAGKIVDEVVFRDAVAH